MERYALLIAGVGIRMAVFHWGPWTSDTPHVSTPYTDGERLYEGWMYLESGESPFFPGSPVHIHPILLYSLWYIHKFPHALEALWIFLDVLILFLVSKISLNVICMQSKAVYPLFWLNPLAILNCCSMSTSSVHCVCILGFTLSVIGKTRPLAAFSGAWLLCLNPTYGPILATWYYTHRSLRLYLDLVLLYAAFASMGGGSAVSLLWFEEIRPNIGLSWYLITEMFLKYQDFYRALLAAHPWVYIYPVFVLLDKHRKYTGYPLSGQLYNTLLIAICFVFNPVPTVPELGIWAALFAPHWKLISAIPSRFVTVTYKQLNGMWIGLILSYLMWVMWTARLGGNANFFYFQTMVYNGMALGFLVGLLNEVKKETGSRKLTMRMRTLLDDLVAEVSK